MGIVSCLPRPFSEVMRKEEEAKARALVPHEHRGIAAHNARIRLPPQHGSTFELEQRITEDSLASCPTTGQSIERILEPFPGASRAPGFH